MVSPRFLVVSPLGLPPYPQAQLQEVFRPNRCACTYGELDHFGFARLLQVALLPPLVAVPRKDGNPGNLYSSSRFWWCCGGDRIEIFNRWSGWVDRPFPNWSQTTEIRISAQFILVLSAFQVLPPHIVGQDPSRRPPWALATASWMSGVALESWWWLLPA